MVREVYREVLSRHDDPVCNKVEKAFRPTSYVWAGLVYDIMNRIVDETAERDVETGASLRPVMRERMTYEAGHLQIMDISLKIQGSNVDRKMYNDGWW